MGSVSSSFDVLFLVRSGAIERAWQAFEQLAAEGECDGATTLALRGRLVKEGALAASGADRRRLYLEAAAAYGAAGEISGSTYPLINAATLALLAGDAGQARARARALLDRIDTAGDDPDETPYYALATRAEALLLLGETARAQASLQAAIALAPRAWEDHASTLRQFALILAEQGEDAGWLDPLRPPRALHFGGGMRVAGEAARRSVGDWLAGAKVGFGYGALAAGADILIAEALVAAGAELHVVLPCPVEAFRRASVVPYGGDWAARFDALLERGDSLHVAGSACPADERPISPQSLQLAAEVAMGRAVMQARVLATTAVQLLAVEGEADGPPAPGGSAWMRRAWRQAGREGERLVLPAEPGEAGAAESGGCLLGAILTVQPSAGGLDPSLVERLGAVVGTGPRPAWPPRWSGPDLTMGFAGPGEAAAAALALAAGLGEAARIGLAYDVMETAADPFGGPELLLGPAVERAAAAAASAPAGAIHATGDFAAALHAGPGAGRPPTEYVGDLASSNPQDPVQLHAIKPPAL